MLTFTLLMKYSLIFDIVNNLGSSFTLLKECVLKEVSKIYFDPTKLLNIPYLQTYLIGILDTKSMSTQYKTEIVTLSKKLPVHAAGIKDDTKAEDTPEQKEEYEKEFKRRLSSVEKETGSKDELVMLARKLSEDATLQSQPIVDHLQIQEVMKKHRLKACGNCLSPNCELKQMISSKLKMKPRKNFRCFGTSNKTQFY